MDIDLRTVAEIVGECGRFPDPVTDGSGYYIAADGAISGWDIAMYYAKLKYAAANSDRLIEGGFDKEFFWFYGVDRGRAGSPEKMCAELTFDSFVLVPERKTVECCVSNPEFMFGHFIEYVWDYDWNLCSVCIN
ncbi:MAG: hypothetical protein K2O14_00525 [Oscillospiraceae bacterium]|nr:hypothetical protein [Oscillospiraceae bacterium]